MKLWRRRKPSLDLVNVRLPSTDDCGHIIVAVPKRVAAGINLLDEENKALNALAVSRAKLCKKHKQELEDREAQIADLVALKRDVEAALDTKDAFIRALNRAYDQKQVELDKALAECKRLHGLLSSADAENLQAQGELATAREEIAGLKLAEA